MLFLQKKISTQSCLLHMIENWKESLDQGVIMVLG